MIKTVGELRALLADVPDSRPIAVFNESMDSFVDFSFSACEVDDEDTVLAVIFTEN